MAPLPTPIQVTTAVHSPLAVLAGNHSARMDKNVSKASVRAAGCGMISIQDTWLEKTARIIGRESSLQL